MGEIKLIDDDVENFIRASLITTSFNNEYGLQKATSFKSFMLDPSTYEINTDLNQVKIDMGKLRITEDSVEISFATPVVHITDRDFEVKAISECVKFVVKDNVLYAFDSGYCTRIEIKPWREYEKINDGEYNTNRYAPIISVNELMDLSIVEKMRLYSSSSTEWIDEAYGSYEMFRQGPSFDCFHHINSTVDKVLKRDKMSFDRK